MLFETIRQAFLHVAQCLRGSFLEIFVQGALTPQKSDDMPGLEKQVADAGVGAVLLRTLLKHVQQLVNLVRGYRTVEAIGHAPCRRESLGKKYYYPWHRQRKRVDA